jgi:hypothetical protein
VQNDFGNPNRCKVGPLLKEIEKKVGWMKRTISKRPKGCQFYLLSIFLTIVA